MALGTCFQVSSVASRATPTATRASVFHAQHPLYKEKLNLPSARKRALSSLSSASPSSSTTPSSVGHRRRGTQFICQAKPAVDAVQAATEANWNEVVASETTVLVEFWAPWCGPCKMIAPVIEELAKEYAGKVMCYQINTDECPNIATKYGIRSIPTVLFFKNGEKKESVIGAVPKSTLSATIEKYSAM